MQSSAIIRLLILTILISCAMASALNIIPVNAQSPCEWTEYSNNPVFGQWLGGAKAYYPKVIYDASQFSGHGDNAAVSVNVIQCGGVGGGSLPLEEYAACPITLALDMQGQVTTVRMTSDGVLCATCVARDASGKHTLQLDEGT
ncbi:MAG: hypothetical protein MUO97_08920, partial [Dehalococcoidia bacterium]|nr:hypothetical protein [Dehalococcoidia bacterium]